MIGWGIGFHPDRLTATTRFMMALPFTRDLVLIGGGHTHALVLRRWGMNPLPGVRLTVINPGPTAPYSGMLPGFVAGHYRRDELDIDLVRLSRFAGARLIDGYADAFDLASQTIAVAGRAPIAYDVASIDVGITSAMPDLPGFYAHAVPAKPLGAFAARWDAFRQSAHHPQIAIIGGGVAGAELAMAMAHALREKSPTVRLIDRSRVLTALGYKARKKMLAALGSENVEIIEDAEVSEIFSEGLVLSDGRTIHSDFTTGAAGAKPHDWVGRIGLDQSGGFLNVDATLQTSDPKVFAVGDCAYLTHAPRPKAGVFAVRQAPVLFANLRNALSSGKMRSYAPQRDYLKLVSLGQKSALAEKWGSAWAGPLLWKLKDHIDRKFMNQFGQLAPMRPPALPRKAAAGLADAIGAQPPCGGCGAKVGRGALQQVLAENFGDDAALIGRDQVISTDHLRAFTHDPALMGRIAVLHGLGDIWAMGAKPQAVTMNIILPRMTDTMAARSLTELMKAATDTVSEAGARIVGGHTSFGDELTIGVTATGHVDKPITLAGAQPGDALILTKPIGSGTVMAAEMQGRARGADVLACFAQMLQPQGQASAILQPATAMTDVTGFGLAGHLRGICDASRTGAQVDMQAVPLMAGAEALCAAGVRSSIFEANQAGSGLIEGAADPLLFDPQTAGGLLAAVPSGQADDCLKALRDAGYPAAIIGQITEGAAIRVA